MQDKVVGQHSCISSKSNFGKSGTISTSFSAISNSFASARSTGFPASTKATAATWSTYGSSSDPTTFLPASRAVERLYRGSRCTNFSAGSNTTVVKKSVHKSILKSTMSKTIKTVSSTATTAARARTTSFRPAG
ncbi:Protein of unknown function [Pyronema omphalodes CBS 100304]|uniref:Uncharacterized protein n=1 Tax=Pyronema omphalodes (strain CBS 100304) TaxID=1076935 RepID=U4LNY1_PYROM|nr:Protein of unknown function [Pyronema omphalodes CBS 100304]